MPRESRGTGWRRLYLPMQGALAAADITTDFTILAATEADPTVIQTSVAHGLLNGDRVWISGCDAVPDINGNVNGPWTVTEVDADEFSIPVEVTAAGTTGKVLKRYDIERFTPGFPCVIEEFGYLQTTVAAGASLALVFELRNDDVKAAQLTLTTANAVAGKARGDVVTSGRRVVTSGDGLREPRRNLTAESVLSIRRIEGDVGSAGAGRFWVLVRAHPAQLDAPRI